MANFVQTTRALLEQMQAQPQAEAADKPVDKAHFCATHVEHALFGPGTCVSESHATPDADGNIAWYTVQFADGIRKLDTKDLRITEGKSHMHSKKPMKEAEEAELTNEGAMSDLDADRKDRAYQTRQAKTTMKHISNPTAGEKKAAKDIKPGIAGYRDRVAMLKSAEARGALKKEDAEVQEANIKHPNQQKLDVHEPEKDELTAKDFEMLRKGKKVEKTIDTEKEMKEGIENVDEKYIGHKKLTGILAAKGAKNPEGLASWIGRKKYGKDAYQKAAAKGQKMKEEVEVTEDFELVDITTTYEFNEQVAIPNKPSFQDYLHAVKILTNNDPSLENEIVGLAQEAFSNQETEILIKAELKAMNEAGAIKMPTATGMRVMGTKYGNSAEAERNRTKKFIDTMKGPSDKALSKIDKPAKAK